MEVVGYVVLGIGVLWDSQTWMRTQVALNSHRMTASDCLPVLFVLTCEWKEIGYVTAVRRVRRQKGRGLYALQFCLRLPHQCVLSTQIPPKKIMASLPLGADRWQSNGGKR